MSDKPAVEGTCTSRFWCSPEEWADILKTADEAGRFFLPPAFAFGMPGRWELVELAETDGGMRVTAKNTFEVVDNGVDLPPREVLEQIQWVQVGTGPETPK